jgi:hypothetical protein
MEEKDLRRRQTHGAAAQAHQGQAQGFDLISGIFYLQVED